MIECCTLRGWIWGTRETKENGKLRCFLCTIFGLFPIFYNFLILLPHPLCQPKEFFIHCAHNLFYNFHLSILNSSFWEVIIENLINIISLFIIIFIFDYKLKQNGSMGKSHYITCLERWVFSMVWWMLPSCLGNTLRSLQGFADSIFNLFTDQPNHPRSVLSTWTQYQRGEHPWP